MRLPIELFSVHRYVTHALEHGEGEQTGVTVN